MRLLGTIAAANAASTNNATTAVPFAMPKNPCTLYIEPAATGLRVAFKGTATADDFQMGSSAWTFPWAGRDTGLIALRNDTGAPINCKVFAADAIGTILEFP